MTSLFSFDSNASFAPRATKERVAERIVAETPTAGYRPITPLRQLTQYSNQLPPLFLFYQEVETMVLHPNVSIALGYYKSGLASAEFEVKHRKPHIAAFIQDIYDRIWANSLAELQDCYEYGWLGAEIVYRIEDHGWLTFDKLRTFHPRDVSVTTREHQYAGIRVRNVAGRDGPVDLWGPTCGLAKAFWHAHRAKYGALWGWSQLLAAWRPWRRLAHQDGGEDIVDMAVYRFGFPGVKGFYPPGQPNVEETGRTSGNPSNQQAMQGIGEAFKAGGNITMPSVFDEKGNRLWDAEIPHTVLDVNPLVEYNASLEKQISLGVGVPPELLQAAETGSGYSGRQIPLEAFYEGQQGIARDFVESIRQQIVRPAVIWNFGEDAADFDVSVKPLLQTRGKRQLITPGDQGNEINAATGYSNGVQRPSGSPFMLSTGWNEDEHPRDDVGQFAHAMTSDQFDQHLQDNDLRKHFGPGKSAVKLAHRGFVEDALRSDSEVPREVRAEYPDLDKRYPATKRPRPAAVVQKALMSKYKASETSKGKSGERDRYASEAKEQGINPDHLHDLAQTLKEQDAEFKADHNQMLSEARRELDHFGGAHRLMAAAGKRGGKAERGLEEGDDIKGMDTVAGDLAEKYPEHFKDSEHAVDTLFGLLRTGNLAPMDDDEAYGSALRQLVDAKESGEYNPDDESEGEADLTVQPWEMTKKDFLTQRTAVKDKQAKIHYRAGFVGRPQPDKDNSREARTKLAADAGFEPGTPEHDQAVKAWALHKLHVAAAVAKGHEVPGEVLAEYPELREPAMLSTGPHKFSSTQFNIIDAGFSRNQGSPLTDLIAMAAAISDDDLAGDGRETEMHVTIKYGLHTADAADVREIIEGFGPVSIRFGGVSIFQASAESVQRGDEAYDVVKVDIISPDLHRLNQLISDSLPHTDSHPIYDPHLTLAYVKPGLGHKYRGAGKVAGDEISCTRLVFSNQGGERTTISLIPDLSPAMLSTFGPSGFSAPLPAEFDTDPILRAALNAISPLHARFVREVLATITKKPTAETWAVVKRLLDMYRNDAGQALMLARLGSALAAMRRVSSVPPSTPQETMKGFENTATPVASLPESGGIFGEENSPAILVPEILGIPEGENPVSSLTQIEEAVSDLKARKILTRSQFDELAAHAREEAFTVTGPESEETLGVIRDSLADAVSRGDDQRAWREALEQSLASDPFLSPAHRETVFRANVYSAYTHGANEVLAHPMLEDAFPYRAIFPILDARCRPWHAALASHGLGGTNVYSASDPIWKLIEPPSDYGCRCGWTPMTVQQAANAGVLEAQEWLRTDTPPENPGRCSLPANWHQSPDWQR